VSENKEHSALGQAAGCTTLTRAEARARFPGHHPDCLCAAKLTVVAYIAVNGARHYKLRCHACRRLSRTSLPLRLLDYPIMAQAPAVRSASASEPRFFSEHWGAADVETHHWAPQSLFHDYNTWPTAQLCPACRAVWHNIMRAGARL
jgi:hypothetical protein